MTPRRCNQQTPTGPCQRLWSPSGCGVPHNTARGWNPSLAPNVYATRPAIAQVTHMSPLDQATATKAVEALGDADTIRRTGTELGEAPSGRLYRLRAGLMRLLVTVDHDDITVVGFGSRPSSAAPTGPRPTF